ncbi:hypothetical protein D9M69_582770 [compost metagenome]
MVTLVMPAKCRATSSCSLASRFTQSWPLALNTWFSALLRLMQTVGVVVLVGLGVALIVVAAEVEDGDGGQLAGAVHGVGLLLDRWSACLRRRGRAIVGAWPPAPVG